MLIKFVATLRVSFPSPRLVKFAQGDNKRVPALFNNTTIQERDRGREGKRNGRKQILQRDKCINEMFVCFLSPDVTHLLFTPTQLFCFSVDFSNSILFAKYLFIFSRFLHAFHLFWGKWLKRDLVFPEWDYTRIRNPHQRLI